MIKFIGQGYIYMENHAAGFKQMTYLYFDGSKMTDISNIC